LGQKEVKGMKKKTIITLGQYLVVSIVVLIIVNFIVEMSQSESVKDKEEISCLEMGTCEEEVEEIEPTQEYGISDLQNFKAARFSRDVRWIETIGYFYIDTPEGKFFCIYTTTEFASAGIGLDCIQKTWTK